MVAGVNLLGDSQSLFKYLDSDKISELWPKIRAKDTLDGTRSSYSIEFMDLIERMLDYNP
jgi:hypothetical protein